MSDEILLRKAKTGTFLMILGRDMTFLEYIMRKEDLEEFIITVGYKETSVISQPNTNPDFSHSSWLNPYLI